MTVVPAGERTALIICDQCGTQDTTADVAGAGDLVWPVVSRLGWTGSAFPTGPHRCPRCSTDTTSTPAPAPSRPPAHGASYGLRRENGATVITPLADLDAVLAEALRDDLMQAAATSPHVVIDLHGVSFIDSAALGLLVRGRQEARHHGASFDLAAPSRFVHTVLHTMRLDGAFRIFEDLPAALDALTGDCTYPPDRGVAG